MRNAAPANAQACLQGSGSDFVNWNEQKIVTLTATPIALLSVHELASSRLYFALEAVCARV